MSKKLCHVLLAFYSWAIQTIMSSLCSYCRKCYLHIRQLHTFSEKQDCCHDFNG